MNSYKSNNIKKTAFTIYCMVVCFQYCNRLDFRAPCDFGWTERTGLALIWTCCLQHTVSPSHTADFWWGLCEKHLTANQNKENVKHFACVYFFLEFLLSVKWKNLYSEKMYFLLPQSNCAALLLAFWLACHIQKMWEISVVAVEETGCPN